MTHKFTKIVLLLGIGFAAIASAFLILNKQKSQSFEGVTLPIYKDHVYKEGSVAAQPGVRVQTPSGNTIIVTIRDPSAVKRIHDDPVKEMNSRVAASIGAYTAEKIDANVYFSGKAEVTFYNTWRKSDKGGEIRTDLPQILSANWNIYYPTKVIQIESLLFKGDMNRDFATIKDLVTDILKLNTNLETQVAAANRQ